MANYPRKVVLVSPKLKEFLVKKGEFITAGRSQSDRVEELEKDMEVAEQNIQEAEKKADLGDLHKKADEITERFNAVVKEMDEVKKQLYARVKEVVPPELYEAYEKAKSAKEKMEKERNKNALKAQKYNDRIIPIVQKLVKPHLENKFEDVERVELEKGVIVASIFSHLHDFETNFERKRKK